MTKLLSQITSLNIHGPDVLINGLSNDSRNIRPGDLYIAIKGAANDGHAFIDQALANGAAAVAVQQAKFINSQASFIVDDQIDQQQGVLASEFYGNPSKALHISAITGTNGKTSICQLAANLLSELSGEFCTKIGTLGIETQSGTQETVNTTPSALLLQKTCFEQLSASKYLVLEASSHALQQGRLNGLQVKNAVFTNLSHDHLDYHGDLASYFAAKLLLFKKQNLQNVVLPLDEPEANSILNALDKNVNVFSFSQTNAAATLFLKRQNVTANGTALSFIYQGQEFLVNTTLVGSFNFSNLALAILLALVEGFDANAVFAKAENLQAALGRMQRVPNQKDILAVVDYAHTPDALEKALTALRPYAKNQLICVFGCGGDRDKAKRPVMAKVAQSLADQIIVTADNPRSESLDQIQAMIIEGFSDNNFSRIDNRQQAIKQAVALAKPGDVVIVAGKGHEKFQQLADKKIAFDDAAVLSQALQEELV